VVSRLETQISIVEPALNLKPKHMPPLNQPPATGHSKGQIESVQTAIHARAAIRPCRQERANHLDVTNGRTGVACYSGGQEACNSAQDVPSCVRIYGATAVVARIC